MSIKAQPVQCTAREVAILAGWPPEHVAGFVIVGLTGDPEEPLKVAADTPDYAMVMMLLAQAIWSLAGQLVGNIDPEFGP